MWPARFTGLCGSRKATPAEQYLLTPSDMGTLRLSKLGAGIKILVPCILEAPYLQLDDRVVGGFAAQCGVGQG